MKHTKEGRLKSRQVQFDNLLNNGFSHDNYKDIDFFTKNDGKYFALKVFRGTAANHSEYTHYHSAERREQVIQNYKNNKDRADQYKEQKKKEGGRSSTHAGAAAAIKQELKQKFPGIKFSVISSSFSMGDSVDISWEDGPTESQVKEISQKYQYGHFNGMEDIYEYTNRREDIPQAKYVSEHRKMSETIQQLLPQISAILPEGNTYDCHNTPDRILYRIFAKCPLIAGYKNAKIFPTGVKCGAFDEFYTISFECDSESSADNQPATQNDSVQNSPGKIQVIEYGKGIAVIGETRPIKDKLGKNGLKGIFNARLSCGPGWVFPKNRLNEVIATLKGEDFSKNKEPQITKIIPLFDYSPAANNQ